MSSSFSECSRNVKLAELFQSNKLQQDQIYYISDSLSGSIWFFTNVGEKMVFCKSLQI